MSIDGKKIESCGFYLSAPFIRRNIFCWQPMIFYDGNNSTGWENGRMHLYADMIVIEWGSALFGIMPWYWSKNNRKEIPLKDICYFKANDRQYMLMYAPHRHLWELCFVENKKRTVLQTRPARCLGEALLVRLRELIPEKEKT